MAKLWDEIKWFLQQKIYVLPLLLTTVCSYGYAIVQPSIGIDDTAMELWLGDGLEVVMGRWTVFLLNKIFHMSDFAPFMLELVGALFLMLAATLFNVLLRRLTGGKAGILVSVIFACLFVSNPIISEIYIYYYHEGIGLGYIMTALSLLSFHEGMQKNGKKRIKPFLLSLFFVWTAVGCYESFLVVYVLGIIVVLFLWGMEGERRQLCFKTMAGYLAVGAALTGACILLRSVTITAVTGLFGLGGVLDRVKQVRRSLTETLVLFDEGGFDNFIMLIKRFWIVYHVNALVYLPVTVYEFAVFCFGTGSVALALRRRNLCYPVLFAGMLVTPFLLTVAEARLTLYRTCQFLPFFAAAGVWLFCYVLTAKGGARKSVNIVVALFGAVLIWNQAELMNRNFYTDYKKYELNKEILCGIANEIEKNYGTDTPVVFAGHYNTPHELEKDHYVSYGSWQYHWIALITDKVDPHLKEKYFSPYGYSFVGESSYPMILWAFDAFDGTNRQMMNFLEMHGYSFPLVTDPETIRQAKEIADTMPGYPKEGSIAQQDGYILVHIQNEN